VLDVYSEERGTRCVVKVLQRNGDRRGARALVSEGRLLLSLTHPHIVRAYALVRRPRPALVLETLPGETLAHLLERRARRRLAARDVARLGVQLASAIRYLHRAGYVHLDLKPSNVICHAGLVKLLDLGIARRPGRIGAGIGSRPYLAPEQARGERVDGAADVFALGAVLYEAAVGRRPFSANRRADDRAPPVARGRRLPARLAHLIDACLDPDPRRRPPTAEVHATLAAIAASRPRSR
jgi:serine/threonine protein kinase